MKEDWKDRESIEADEIAEGKGFNEEGPEADSFDAIDDVSDQDDIAKKAWNYLDSDPVKSLYGDDSYEEHINPEEGEDFQGEKGRVNQRKKQQKEKRSERFKWTRKRKPRKKVHKKKHYFLKFLGICAIIVAIILFMSSSIFDLKKIDVTGNKHYQAEDIVKMSGLKTGTNIFKLHGSKAKKKIAKDSYIKDVELHKHLPSKVSIEVEERKEVAFIGYGKKFVLLDGEANVLKLTDKKPELTELVSLEVKDAKEGEVLEVKNQSVMDEELSILKAMEDRKLFFKKIEISKSVSKVYIYDKLICKGSTDNVLENIENGNLEMILADLIEKKTNKGTINMGDDKYCSFSPEV